MAFHVRWKLKSTVVEICVDLCDFKGAEPDLEQFLTVVFGVGRPFDAISVKQYFGTDFIFRCLFFGAIVEFFGMLLRFSDSTVSYF